MPERPRGEVALPAGSPQPFVHPGVPPAGLDHAALQRAATAAKRRQNQLPKTTMPVAGGESPPIPNLSGAPGRPGMTMADHARIERGPAPVAAAPSAPAGFVEPASSHGNVPSRGPQKPPQLSLLPTDELPPAAQRDPAYVQGAGSVFAVNQPALAAKYGVLRRGQLVPAQALQSEPSQKLRPETVRGLEDLARLQRQQGEIAVPPREELSEMGRASGVVADAAPRDLTDSDKKEIQETLKGLDEFDFDRYRQAVMKDILNNEEQRKIIEARLKPMDVSDLIINSYLVQRVPITSGFVVDFKTLDAETDLALKRIIMEDSVSVQVSDRYYLDKFGMMSVAAVVHRINDKPFGDITDAQGNFDDEKFRSKFNRILKLPMPMIASLGVNAMWFDARVRKLFKAEEVGNG